MGRKGGEETMPLTFDIIDDGNIIWKLGAGTTAVTIEYSKNGGAWTSITSTSEGTTIPVVAGDEVKFRGNTWTAPSNSYSHFNSTCTFAAKGNPASLRYGDVLTGKEPMTDGNYLRLFQDATLMITPPVLPATILSPDCYMYMFMGCTSLMYAPELPATTLESTCYSNMFRGCTSLAAAPELPATTLESSCYLNMFYGCTSLAAAPELPATTLAQGCYNSMFRGCTSLREAPDLPATTLANNCYANMFYDCTSLILAPELEAPVLVQGCYYYMFRNCSQLSQIICPATDISASSALSNWVSGVAAQGTFYKAAGVNWITGPGGIPSGWTVIEV